MPHKATYARGADVGRQDALRRFKAEVFRVLAHPTRIYIVECLRDGDLSVGALLERIAVEPANLSQHLGVLRSKGLVSTRKDGNQVFYSLRDPLLIEVLDAYRAVPSRMKNVEVHVFPESMRGTGEGHRPMDAAPGSTVTDATVASVTVGRMPPRP